MILGYIKPSVMVPVGYGKRLDQLLQKHNINMSELSKRINCDHKTLYRVYEGKNASIDTVIKIVNYFNVDAH